MVSHRGDCRGFPGFPAVLRAHGGAAEPAIFPSPPSAGGRKGAKRTHGPGKPGPDNPGRRPPRMMIIDPCQRAETQENCRSRARRLRERQSCRPRGRRGRRAYYGGTPLCEAPLRCRGIHTSRAPAQSRAGHVSRRPRRRPKIGIRRGAASARRRGASDRRGADRRDPSPAGGSGSRCC